MHEGPEARLFRAAIPGRPTGLTRQSSRAEQLWAPGRASLEWSILLSTVALVVPIAAAGALVFSEWARRAGNRRWLIAMVMSVWCALLGVLFRRFWGLGLVP